MKQYQNSTNVNLVVLGANGGIGKEVVQQALEAGHNVTAILRTPEKLALAHPGLEIQQGDVMNSNTLETHLKNKDVVVSAIGKNSLKKTILYSQGNKNLIDAMKKAGVNRAFFISASGLEVNPTYSFWIRFATKYILQNLLRNMYDDLRRMEKIVKESGIDWTIIRPPKLLNGPVTGNYRVATEGFLNKGLKISRADVAHFIVHNLANQSTLHKTVEVAY